MRIRIQGGGAVDDSAHAAAVFGPSMAETGNRHSATGSSDV
jgi:hypothetical protein